MGLGRRRPQVPRLHQRVLVLEPGTPPPANRARARRASGPAHAHVARRAQRPHGTVPREALPARGLRDGAADEHGRRSRRDRDQARAEVGVSREARTAGPSRDRRVPRQLPRSNDDDRRVLVGAAVPGRLRALLRRLSARRLWRHRATTRRARAEHGLRSSSSLSKPRRGSSCRPTATSPRRARYAASATCCSCSTRFRRASAGPASCSRTSTSPAPSRIS